MTVFSRGIGRPAPFACHLLLLLALLAQSPLRADEALPSAPAALPSDLPTALPPSALPSLPDQSDPWLYRGSDVPHDKDWVFGSLPNGLKWAVRHNGVPPGQVAIRIRIDAGSLNERPGEEGFAHLIEHLVFRQSRYLGEAQAIAAWQRLGASFGTDTNAETTPLHTVFKIDLPDATPAKLDESFKLLSGMMIAPTLSESDIRTEVPIVLAEKREHGGAAERIEDATRQVMFYGQPMADHATIGSVGSVSSAHEAAVKAFYNRWYRPENAAIIVAGDADPRLLAALIGKWFAAWPTDIKNGGEPPTPQPDFGTPKPAPGANLAISPPVGPVRVVIEPQAPRDLIYAIVRPWHEKHDTIVYNDGLMTDQVAEAIINRRLEQRARAGAPFISAQVNTENESRSIDATFVDIQPIDGQWREALREVRNVIADAEVRAPTRAEIAREVAEIGVAFASQAEQRAIQPGARIADDLVQALDIHETVAAPETVRDLFHAAIPLFTPEAILAHTKRLFSGVAERAIRVTPDPAEGDDAALQAALETPVTGDGVARLNTKPIAFADLPPIGPEAPPPAVVGTGLFGVEQIDFANGVHVLLWATKDDPGRATVKVRFGAGLRAFAPDEMAVGMLGTTALVGAGEGRLGQEELDRITTGRKVGFQFHTDEGFFSFTGETRSADLADQLYLFANKFAQPRWDAAPLARAQALARAQYPALAASPQGVLERDLKWLEHRGDPRYHTPTPAEVSAVSPAQFRAVWGPILANGPIEVEVYGDVNRAEAIAALRRTFGALPARTGSPVIKASDAPPFATPNAEPTVLTHKGDANQAAAVIAWPTGGGRAGLRQARMLDVLAQVFQNRLLLAMREKAGTSYAPQVGSEWPIDLASGGAIVALAQLDPQHVPDFFTAADGIAADLAQAPISADELALVTGPLRQQIERSASSTAFFMTQIEGATADPTRLAAVHGLLNDYVDVTPAQLQLLAQRYLMRARAWRLAVLPEAAAH